MEVVVSSGDQPGKLLQKLRYTPIVAVLQRSPTSTVNLPIIPAELSGLASDGSALLSEDPTFPSAVLCLFQEGPAVLPLSLTHHVISCFFRQTIIVLLAWCSRPSCVPALIFNGAGSLHWSVCRGSRPGVDVRHSNRDESTLHTRPNHQEGGNTTCGVRFGVMKANTRLVRLRSRVPKLH